MQNFLALTADEQLDAIKRLAADGWSDYTIAAATRLSVECVRQLLGAPKATPA